MKKILLTFLIAIAANFTFGQSVNFGIKAGLNFSNQSYNNLPANLNTNSKRTGFHAGAMLDVGIHNFSIQPGVFFTTKGKNETYLFNDYVLHTTTIYHVSYTLNYFEVPVNLLYHIRIIPGISAYLGTGPYLAYGLSGTLANDDVKTDLKFGTASNKSNYRNPDYGVNFLAGVKLKKFLVDLNYGLGLVNLSYIPNEKHQNKVIGLSLGYMFK